MSFDTRERSEYGGAPVELYKFANSDTIFRYSSGEEVVFNRETYPQLEITRRNISQSGSLDRGDLILYVPADSALAREYIGRIPPTPYWLNIFRVHFGDGDSEVRQFSQWRVLTVTPKNELAEVRLESIITAQNYQGLQDEYQELCNWYLYDGQGCPVRKELHTRIATVTALSGDTITVSGLGSYIDGWFEGGYVELSDGDQRDVLKWIQSTNKLTITHAFASSSLQVGDVITVYDGCKHRHVEDCIAKFGSETNNGEAFGGYPYPGATNPFNTAIA